MGRHHRGSTLVGERFKIIMTGLLDTQMGVNGSVTCCSGQLFVLPVQDMKVDLQVHELLHETEINDIDLVAIFANSHNKGI